MLLQGWQGGDKADVPHVESRAFLTLRVLQPHVYPITPLPFV